MKKTLQCPKCDGRKIAHVPQVAHATAGRMSLTFRTGALGAHLPVSGLEAFVCTACGYSELYTTDVDALLRGQGVRIIDNEPKATLR